MKKHSNFTAQILLPLAVISDILFINLFAYFLPINLTTPLLFHSYIVAVWSFIAIRIGFYNEFRYVKVVVVLRVLTQQFFFYFLSLYAFIGFFKQPNMSRLALAEYVLLVFLIISLVKLLTYVFVLGYREKYRSDFRNVIVIGKNRKADQLIEVFNDRLEFGFSFKKQFSPKDSDFSLNKVYNFVETAEIQEIYCSVSELRNEEIRELINYADNNLKTLKFLPDDKNIYSQRLTFEYYDYLPVISLRDIPLHNRLNAALKRGFDILFSLMVIFGILIWLGPFLALLIRIESKGPLFFVQRRSGLDNKPFYCYKFRSMAVNKDADKIQAGRNDMRVTRIGKILRKTSIDELPQFYNVLFGNMSVVGPRPHMIRHTEEYAEKVDKYMVRHFVKPGITGLAQIRGYRGEIVKHSDILNRVKFDVFYIENWSFLLDIKIIVQTVFNAFKGEKKAY
jgi:putative colanic acid biosynthesis UDP-glucose lipid carrier transferase